MPTSFKVIFLGTLPKIDTTQGNEVVENAGGILGIYGSATGPLSGQVRNLTAERISEDDNNSYDLDNGGGHDSFRINGGAAQNFDAVAEYNAVITYVDGTTATITATILQDVNGNTYLAPKQTSNADQTALTAKPIQSVSLNSVSSNSGDMVADRVAGDFRASVDGTGGNDSMGNGYTDAQGDKITAGADVIFGGDGNDTINALDCNDTVYGGAGDDVIDDWNGNDLVYGGDGNDFAHASSGNDTIDVGAGQDHVRTWDNAGAKTLFGGSGYDRLEFGNWQSSTGVSVTYNADGSGSFSHFSGATTGSFSQFEFVEGTSFADTVNGTNATGAVEMDGKDGADVLSGGSGNDKIWGGSGQDSLVGNAGADQLYGGDANDTLNDGAGNDAICGANGSDLGFGGEGNDSFGSWNDEGGNDTFHGDAGNDSIIGGGGNDLLYGGTGSDTLFGGAGNDSIDGGAGNDVLSTGEGIDTVVLEMSGGRDVIADFNMTLLDNKTTDQLDVSDLINAAGNPVTWADVIVTDTNGDGTGDAILSFPNGESVVLQGVSPSAVDSKSELVRLGIPCFAAGSPILTPSGPRAVETLARGDLVETTNGPAPVIWAGSRSLGPADLAADPGQRPVHFAPGAIGNSQPLRLSPQHAVLIRASHGAPVLVRAKHLAKAGMKGVRIANGVQSVTYHHLLLGQHAILSSAGAAVESMYPGPMALATFPAASRLAIAAAIIGGRCVGTGSVIDLGDLSNIYGPKCMPLLGRKDALQACRATYAMQPFTSAASV